MYLLRRLISILGLATYVAHSRGELASLSKPPDLSDLRHEEPIFQLRPPPGIDSGIDANARFKISSTYKSLTVGPRCGPKIGRCDVGLCCSPLGKESSNISAGPLILNIPRILW
jgi:hypothetical protein